MIPILFIYLSPFYILLTTAFKAPDDASSRWQPPNYLFFENFRTALSGKVLTGIRDSLIITVIAVTLIVIIGSMAAYPLARNKSKLNKAVRAFIMGVMMVPPLTILVPMLKVMLTINDVFGVKLISTYPGIIMMLVTFQLPLSIFIFSSFITSIPTALDEAAAIDGCGPIRAFFRIILPQLKPVTTSVVILTGVTCWNDYMFSLYILKSSKINSVTQAVSLFFGQVNSNVPAAAAAAVIGILPIVVLFLFLQKYFIQGMVDSAVK